MQAPRQAKGPKNDINVTPLVDVVLVLLIIFMVITPMLQKGAEVQLPVTEHPKDSKAEDNQVTITVQAKGELFWETQPKNEGEIVSLLEATFQKDSSTPIFVKGDQNAPYVKVRQVMKMVQEAGFPQVGIIVKDVKER